MIRDFEYPQWEAMGAMCMDPVTATIAAAVIGAGATVYSSKSAASAQKKQAGQMDAAQLAAQRRQEQSLQSQQAIANRQRNEADKREAELDKRLAGQRRAITARRSSRGQLAFSGPAGGLKQTLGG